MKSQVNSLCLFLQWEQEKWKFKRGNQVVFVNHATQQGLRIRTDGGVDGLGDPSHSQCKCNRKIINEL